MFKPTNSFYHLRSLILQYQNSKVDQWFENELFNKKAHVKAACQINQDDSALVILIKLVFFLLVVGFGKNNYFAIPTENYYSSVRTFPQVILTFRESRTDALKNQRQQLSLEISWRILKSLEEIDFNQYFLNIQNRIKALFLSPRYQFSKGRIIYSYTDQAKGYNFKIYANDESQVRNLISKVLNINGDTPNWENLSETMSNRNYEKSSVTQINGVSYSKSKLRQSALVGFEKAEVSLGGLLRKPILLVHWKKSINGIILPRSNN